MTDSEPIRKYQPIRRASIAPATSVAPEAPVMVAPGAPTMESPVSQASREREARVRKQFKDIEARYGRHPDVRHRRAEMRMSEPRDDAERQDDDRTVLRYPQT